MKLFRIIGALALLCAWAPAHAQVSNAIVVAACGTPPATYSAGANRQITQDTTGTLCTVGGGGGGGGSTSISQATPGTTNGVNVNHSSYTLLTNGTSAGATNLLADTYSLNLPATFNGATISVAFTSANGTVQTNTYTSQPATPPVFLVYAGTSATATATGGTPTGNTVLAGGPAAGGSGGGGGSNAAAGTTGAAVPGSASYTGFNVGGNLVGVSSGNPLPVTGSFSATTTGTASASAPTYTAGSNPLSLNLAGGLRVDGSGVTQPVSAASLPLPTGAATAAGLTTINTTLGTPFQAGGSISNTSFASTLGTTNGWTPKLANGLTTTVLSVKSSAGQVGTLQCYNPNSAQAYVQVFNVASGSVTLGTTTPALSIAIAPTSTGGLALSNPGINFSAAISIAATTTATGSTANATAIDCNVAFN